jgi:hypothetical protein
MRCSRERSKTETFNREPGEHVPAPPEHETPSAWYYVDLMLQPPTGTCEAARRGTLHGVR